MMDKPHKVKTMAWRKRLTTFVALVGTFIYGIGVGHYRWFPFWQVKGIKHAGTGSTSSKAYRGEQELLQYAFTNPIIKGDLIYEPITSLVGIHEANKRIFMLREGFDMAYNTLQVTNTTQLQLNRGSTPVVQVSFTYQERDYDAYAYGTLPDRCEGKGNASLIIPGSGFNQSEGIFSHDRENYHFGIQTALQTRKGDVFIFIKPNEGILAWHDGQGNKLNGDFIWNWHLNREGSYSVSYLVQSLAIVRWMEQCYEKRALLGLSQGGSATLLNAVQSHPDIAVVASGHSLLNKHAQWSGPGQLIGVPGYSNLFEATVLKEKLRLTPTQWLFSWGLSEVGTYRIEAEERYTAQVIEVLPNVKTVIFEGGHVFPLEAMKDFFEESL